MLNGINMSLTELKEKHPNLSNAEIFERFKNQTNIKRAINRLSWRMSSKRPFKPNENDTDSLNCVIDFINKQQSDAISSNRLFAKLYIYCLHQNIRHYGTTIFDKIPQKDLSKTLNMPLEYFYKAFHKDLHHNQFNLVETFSDFEEVKEMYDLEDITERLDEMVFLALNKFS